MDICCFKRKCQIIEQSASLIAGVSAVMTEIPPLVNVNRNSLGIVIFNQTNDVTLGSFELGLTYNNSTGATLLRREGIYLLTATVNLQKSGSDTANVELGIFTKVPNTTGYHPIRTTETLQLINNIEVKSLHITTAILVTQPQEIYFALVSRSGGSFLINGSSIATKTFMSIQKIA